MLLLELYQEYPPPFTCTCMPHAFSPCSVYLPFLFFLELVKLSNSQYIWLIAKKKKIKILELVRLNKSQYIWLIAKKIKK